MVDKILLYWFALALNVVRVPMDAGTESVAVRAGNAVVVGAHTYPYEGYREDYVPWEFNAPELDVVPAGDGAWRIEGISANAEWLWLYVRAGAGRRASLEVGGRLYEARLSAMPPAAPPVPAPDEGQLLAGYVPPGAMTWLTPHLPAGLRNELVETMRRGGLSGSQWGWKASDPAWAANSSAHIYSFNIEPHWFPQAPDDMIAVTLGGRLHRADPDPNTGEMIGGVYVCPELLVSGDPFKVWTEKLPAELATYKAAGCAIAIVDYESHRVAPRWGCFDARCLARFEAETGKKVRAKRPEESLLGPLLADWLAFRARQNARIIHRLADACAGEGLQLWVCSTFWPASEADQLDMLLRKGMDPRLLDRPNIVLHPMMYLPPTRKFLRDLLSTLRECQRPVVPLLYTGWTGGAERSVGEVAVNVRRALRLLTRFQLTGRVGLYHGYPETDARMLRMVRRLVDGYAR